MGPSDSSNGQPPQHNQQHEIATPYPNLCGNGQSMREDEPVERDAFKDAGKEIVIGGVGCLFICAVSELLKQNSLLGWSPRYSSTPLTLQR